MRPQDRRWCLALSAVLIVLTTIPYVLGYQSQGTEWRFTGFVFGVEDGNSYIAKMLQGAQGAWLFRTPYAARVETGVIAFLPYLLLGKLAAGADLHTQHVALYHLARAALIPVAVFSIFRFASAFLQEDRWRRWASVLVAAGGGLGWALIASGQTNLLGSLPLELYSPETFGFLSFYGLPHLLLSRILLLTALSTYIAAGPGWRRGLLSGIALFGLGLVQPLTVISAYAAIGGHLAILALGRAIRRATWDLREWATAGAVAVMISVPVMAYYMLGTESNPALRDWTAQNVLPSPHPIHYLIAFGLLLIPAFVGAKRAIRDDGAMGTLLPTWFVMLFLLAYAPVAFQRRLADGAWVALVVLAARGLSTFSWTVGWRRFVPEGLMVGSLITTGVLLIGGMWSSFDPGPPLFRPAGETRAIRWMAENVRPESVVLSSFEVGNVLPAWAPLRSVMGHGPETPDLATVRPRVERFFGDPMDDAERGKVLDDYLVDYVFHGPAERRLGAWEPGRFDGLREIFRDGEYAVYTVQP